MVTKAPELERFLQKLRSSVVNYCAVCLRTDSERILVKNKAFKQFCAAMNIDNLESIQGHLICNMCERQASKALQFYKAATFASAVDKMFRYLLVRHRQRLDAAKVFEEWHFNALLMELKLNNSKFLPQDVIEWEDELKRIRNMTTLNETKTLLVDNDGASVAEPDVSDLYVVPDDIPKHKTSIHTLRKNTITLGHRQYNPPVKLINRRASQRVRSANKKYMNDFVCGKPKKDKKNEKSAQEQNALNFELSDPLEPETPETLVILDDEEDKDSLQIRIEKVRSEAALPDPAAPVTSNKGAPKLVPIEKLLEPKPAEPLLVPQENFMLHPIVVNQQGMLVVPSLQMTIENGHLVNQVNTENPILQDLLNSHQKEITVPTNEVTQTNVIKRRNDFEDLSVIIDNGVIKKVSGVTPNKKSKGLPVISEVRSEAQKNDRIDWEDKIPMDVITFLDAVDPNCPIKTTNMGPSIGLSQVTNVQQPSSNVIDLC